MIHISSPTYHLLFLSASYPTAPPMHLANILHTKDLSKETRTVMRNIKLKGEEELGETK